MSLSGKWSRFLHWCHGKNIDSRKATSADSKILSVTVSVVKAVPAIKWHRSSLSHVFSLVSMVLVPNRIICRMLSSFEKSHPHKEVKLPEWNHSQVL